MNASGRLEIAGAHVVDAAQGLDGPATIHVEDGRIRAIGGAPSGWREARRLDASGLVAVPGLVDLAARLREPGLEYKATLESEVRAALAGGVTTLACPPDTDPPLDEPGLVEMLKHRARSLGGAHVHPIGALTVGLAGAAITEMGELAKAGCIAFSQADRGVVDLQVLLRAMQYAATFGHAVWLRPQDPHLAAGGVAHDGEVATRLGLAPVPSLAETVALASILSMARATGVRLHLCRLSTAEGVAMVRAAKVEGLPVTADVGIHHLHLCEVDIGWFDPQANFVPPLRSTRDRDALTAGVLDGTIDAICSDHTPVDDDAKQVPFAEADPGATGLELLLPLLLRWAERAGRSLPEALALVTSRPASILGVEAGSLAPGMPADLCLFDPEARWRVEPRELRSQGRNTPFAGIEMTGRVRWTLVGGEVVFESA